MRHFTLSNGKYSYTPVHIRNQSLSRNLATGQSHKIAQLIGSHKSTSDHLDVTEDKTEKKINLPKKNDVNLSKHADSEEQLARRFSSQFSSDHYSSSNASYTMQSYGEMNSTTASPIEGDGKALPDNERRFFESQLNTDLSHVRIHDNAYAWSSAEALNAKAYTYGNHIVFNHNRYQTQSGEGKKLLAHEMAHVSQQKTKSQPIVQRDENDMPSSFSSSFSLSQSTPWWQQSSSPRLSLMPEIEAELAAMRVRLILQQLSLAQLRSELMGSLTLPPWQLVPTTPQTPGFMDIPSPEPEAPLVPAGRGPSTVEEGSAGDVLSAILAIPSVDQGLTNLRNQVTGQIERDWNRLSTGEQVFVGSFVTLVGSTAITGLMANEDTRTFILEQLNGKSIGVPLVPGLSFQGQFTGDNPGVMFTLDLQQIINQ